MFIDLVYLPPRARVQTEDPLGVVMGAIVLISKYPTRGKTKSRIASLLGEEDTLTLAFALLMDVIYNVQYAFPTLSVSGKTNAAEHQVNKIISFVPPTAFAEMEEVSATSRSWM